MAEGEEPLDGSDGVPVSTADSLRATDLAVFRTAVIRLVLDAAYIAVFLVLEWGLITLVRITLGARSSGEPDQVINVIQIGSAVVAALFFALHFVGALVRYSLNLVRDLRER